MWKAGFIQDFSVGQGKKNTIYVEPHPLGGHGGMPPQTFLSLYALRLLLGSQKFRKLATNKLTNQLQNSRCVGGGGGLLSRGGEGGNSSPPPLTLIGT